MGLPIKKNGFSLVEILISLLILGIGIVVLFNLFSLSWQSLSYSRRLNEIGLFAQRKIEELKSEGISSQTQTSGEEENFTWSVLTKPLGAPEGLYFVQLNVEFKVRGIPQQQKFVTYIAGK